MFDEEDAHAPLSNPSFQFHHELIETLNSINSVLDRWCGHLKTLFHVHVTEERLRRLYTDVFALAPERHVENGATTNTLEGEFEKQLSRAIPHVAKPELENSFRPGNHWRWDKYVMMGLRSAPFTHFALARGLSSIKDPRDS